MRICYFADGNSSHVEKWINYFHILGHDVTIISKKKKPLNFNDSIKYFRLPYRYGKVICDILSIFYARLFIHNIKPDIVHGHYLTDYGSLATMTGFHPVVVSIWGSDIIHDQYQSRIYKILINYSLKHADAITCTSQYLYDQIPKEIIRNKPVEIIPFGVDTTKFSPKFEKKTIDRTHSIKIGVIKNYSRICGIEYFIEALSIINQQGIQISATILGRQNEEEYRDLVVSKGLKGNIQFIDNIPNAEIPSFLETLDILVIPSLSESFGVVALEAQAMKIPVIATNVGGLPEVIIDKKTGLLIEPKNPEAIANAILYLCDNPEISNAMGNCGREYVNQYFEKNICSTKMLKLYQNLLSEYSKR